jgi:hypothetical protein
MVYPIQGSRKRNLNGGILELSDEIISQQAVLDPAG